jgi:predicted  nucleic acid-binding Zn-ribbon protein
VEGEGNIKYSYNNGHIANDPVLASQNFLKALEKMPSLIEHHETKAEALAKVIPPLQDVVKTTWRREDELKDLKTELAALNRKIELSLKPLDESEEKKEEKQQEKPLNSNMERLQEFKQTMGDRLVVASVPKYHTEHQPKGMKL